MSEIFGRLGGPRDDQIEQAESEPGSMVANERAGRWLRRHHAGGVAALTTVVDGLYRASSITGFMVASLDPFLMLVSIESESQMESWLRDSRIFGLSLLGFEQQFLADRFAGMAPLASPHFAGIPHFTATTGAPLLTDCIGWADCSVTEELSTGDHTLFLGRALAAGRGAAQHDDPLLYYLSRYVRLR